MKNIFLILFFSISVQAVAHSDFYVSRNYGNTKSYIKTGFEYEEINKALIIGQLSEKLSKELNYNDTILLHFNHHYTITEKIEPDYFVSYNNDLKRIEIKVHGNRFEVTPTLKLVEYAITNIETLRKQQSSVHYTKHYNNADIMTIDVKAIKKILGQKDSKLITSTIDNKIYRPDGLGKEDRRYEVSYYWQNNKFHVIQHEHNGEVPIMELANIYTIHRLDLITVIFDSNKTFYHINTRFVSMPETSRKLVIENEHDYYRPHWVSDIGGGRITVHFEYYTKDFDIKNVTLVYFPDKDLLIQDLDKMADEYIERLK